MARDRWHQKTVKRTGGVINQVYRREVAGAQKMRRLVSIYSEAERAIVEKLQIMVNGSPTSRLLEQQKKAIDEILKQLHKDGMQAAKSGVNAVYRGGFKAGRDELVKAGVVTTAARAEMGNIHRRAVDVYSEQVLSRLSDVETTAGRTVMDIYSQLRLNTDLSGAVAGVESITTAQQKLKRASDSGGLVAFIDKAGKNWNMSTYTEMLARTTLMQVHNKAKEIEFAEHGEDLVIVSSHLPTCDMCLPYNGAILSISGKTDGYTSMEEAEADGLFHPNCRHSFSLYIEQAKDGTSEAKNDAEDEETQKLHDEFKHIFAHLSDEDLGYVWNAMKNAPEGVLNLCRLYGSNMDFVHIHNEGNHTAYFWAVKRKSGKLGCYFDLDKLRARDKDDGKNGLLNTILHEMGHYFDCMQGALGIYKSESMFKSALRKYKAEYKNQRQVYAQQYFSQTGAQLPRIEKCLYEKIGADGTLLKQYGKASDILDALTYGDLWDRGLCAGHGSRYYSERGNKETEIFANMQVLFSDQSEYSKNALKVIRDNFPELVEEYEKYISGVKYP